MRKKITILFLSIIIIILSLSSHAQLNRRDNKKSVPYRANYQRMSSGCSSDHSFEIREGTLWGWGSNDSGQVGDGTTINRRKPVQVGTDDNWISVSTGLTHTLGLKADGTLWAWGYNGYGELGDGTKTIRHTPVQIGNDSSWISISAGQHFSLALKSDGKLWAWGLNYYGQLGDGTDTNRLTPTLISSDSNWVSISTGLSQCHAIKSDGTLWAWGRNGSGNLGDSSYYNRYTPIQIGTENTWVNLIAGNESTFGLKSNGSLWGWGWNRNGCIGYGVVSETNQLIPARIGTDNKWINISFSPSSFHSLGIKANGTFWSWGQNYFGQLGKGDTSDRYSPSQIGNNRNWANIVTGGSHSIGLKSNRKQFCATGYNSYGQLGDGTTKDKNNLTCNSNCIAPLAPIDSTKTSALTICSGTKTTLYAVGLGSVSWYTDSIGGTFLASGNYYSTPALTQSTSYYAQDSTCTISAKRKVIKVTVNPLPKASVGSTKTICKFDSVIIGASSVSGNTYSWSSNASGFTSTKSNPAVNPAATTIYYLTETIATTGCTKSDSVIVNVNPLPSAIVGSNKTICNGDSVSIGASSVNGNTYSWSSSPNGFTSANSNPTVNPTVTTIYYLTETITATGCKKLDSVTVNVNPLPSANVGSNKTICYGDSIIIGANAVNGNTYSWSSIPNGFTSSSANPAVTPLINTVYYLTETITATGCAKSDSVSIKVNRTFNTITKTACNIYTFKGNTITNSGTYYDTLKNSVGCDSIITLNLTIIQSSYNTLTKTACDKYTFKGNSLTNSGAYYDTLTNAVGCDSIITLNLTINNSTGITIYDTACGSYTFKGNTITSSGIYYDTLTNSVGCDSVVTLHLTMHPSNFSLAFTQNTQVFTSPPFDVLFLNTTPNKNNYAFTWLFGDGTYYNGTNPPKHTYQANGNYDVTLIAQNNTTGCTDTLYKQGWILCSGGVTCTHTAQIIQTNIAKKCMGDSIYLSCISDSDYTYQWLYNGIKIQGSNDSFIYAKTAGLYSVTVTDSFCPLTSASVVIGFHPLAIKPTIFHNGNLTFCTGDSVELYVNNIYNTYNWNTGSQTYHSYASNSGTYFVTVNDSNGCQAQSDTFSLNASFISPPPICLVSVDSATNKNIIIWEKAQAGSIDSFVILKETNQANIYNIIGKLPYTAFSTFVDTASNPDVQANRYKLQAIDTCGITTLPSDFHKTIHLTINKGQGSNWNLIWSHYEGIQFSSYNIYRGSSNTNMSLLTTIASNLNSYTDVNPPAGNLYYQIEVVNSLGCTPSQKTNSFSSSLSNIADVGTIGINNIYNTKYTVFPNPTNSQLTIQSSKKLSNATIKLYNITGQLIIQKTNVSGDNFIIDLSDYAKGIYILEIGGSATLTTGVERVKVVKE